MTAKHDRLALEARKKRLEGRCRRCGSAVTNELQAELSQVQHVLAEAPPTPAMSLLLQNALGTLTTNAYLALQVPADATNEALRRAFRRLSGLCVPASYRVLCGGAWLTPRASCLATAGTTPSAIQRHTCCSAPF